VLVAATVRRLFAYISHLASFSLPIFFVVLQNAYTVDLGIRNI
jgi:hypothetical protein